MARSRFIPETEKPERRYGRDDEDFRTTGFDPEPTGKEEIPWELQSVANFVEDKMDCDQTTFTGGELQALAANTGIPYILIKDELTSFGLSLAGMKREPTFRTFGDNPHNRWLTPEARQGAGGGGGGSIMGMCS